MYLCVSVRLIHECIGTCALHVTGTHSYATLSMWVLEIPTQVLMLAEQALLPPGLITSLDSLSSRGVPVWVSGSRLFRLRVLVQH